MLFLLSCVYPLLLSLFREHPLTTTPVYIYSRSVSSVSSLMAFHCWHHSGYRI